MLNGPKGYKPDSFKDSLPMKVQITARGDAEQVQISFTELQQPRDASVRKLLATHKDFVTGVKVG